MDADASEIIGRKTFFIGFDAMMLPEAYLESFLARGYETYRIPDDHVCALRQKIELVLTLFKGSLLIFYVDSNQDWPGIISGLLETHSGDATMAVAYGWRSQEAERTAMERLYARLGLNRESGIIMLNSQRGQNFQILDQVLAANNARGRRKHVRALCGAGCTANFIRGGTRITAALQDVSLNHFSCLMDGMDIIPYEKCAGTQLLVHGIRFQTDTMFLTSREMSGGMLHVFAFLNPNGAAGLEDSIDQKLRLKIYQLVTDPTKAELLKAFQIMNKYRDDIRPKEAVIGRVLTEMRCRQDRPLRARRLATPYPQALAAGW